MYQGINNAKINAKCPYFQRDSAKKISCEGVGGASNLAVEFETEYEKDRYELEHCLEYPNNCFISKMLEENYAADE